MGNRYHRLELLKSAGLRNFHELSGFASERHTMRLRPQPYGYYVASQVSLALRTIKLQLRATLSPRTLAGSYAVARTPTDPQKRSDRDAPGRFDTGSYETMHLRFPVA